MKVTLKNYPADADKLCGLAAALCTRSDKPDSARENAVESGHLSVLEHAAFTFEIEGVSRALLAQLTRHRVASFSVESQRYISMVDCFDFVIPPAIEALGDDARFQFRTQMELIHTWYCDWHDRLMKAGRKKQEANEDARYVLPNACVTKLMLTMNARELLHFFDLRCCNKAQWEIRHLAWLMLEECRIIAPETFKRAGPSCAHGPCPEKHSCGRPHLPAGVTAAAAINKILGLDEKIYAALQSGNPETKEMADLALILLTKLSHDDR